ncbi:hypothetical protein [Acidianus bottle-shaped virus]|nr:hypothetical protein ABV_gp30 [Acidianus bottle-shaped virus]ABP73420.1 hypothetical protein [Acidianus bottle-shaped virus]
MDPFVSMFQTFLEVLTATVLAFTAYEAYERRMERQEKGEAMRDLIDLHRMRTIGDVIEKQEETKEKQAQGK